MPSLPARAIALGGFLLATEAPLCAAWLGPAPAATVETGTTSLRSPRELAGTPCSGSGLPARRDASPAGAGLAEWSRRALAAVAAFAVLAGAAAGAPRAARAEEGGGVQLYFGQGCFWHVQHDVVKQEVKELGRDKKDVTALVGYAGGLKAGDKGRVCYHNMAMAPDYGQLGHTEVVNVTVPESKVRQFAKWYIDAAAGYPQGRADPQDRGGEYRSAIGLPGGMDGPLFKEVEAANNGRMTFVRGQGNDSDTVRTKTVWVYDSQKFPFFQGEVYHQFHDDMTEQYSDSYHKIKGMLQEAGRLKTVECPEIGF